MPNIRIIHDNAADRATLSTTTSLAAGLPLTNLVSDTKSRVCRSTTKNLVITAIWTVAETVGAVILPFTNFSPTATIQVQAYTNAADPSPILNVTSNAGAGYTFTGSQWNNGGVNSFAYGGGTYARIWLASKVLVKKIVITIADAGNTAAYIEASRLIIGDYWQPLGVGAEEGATMTIEEDSKHFRTGAGDLVTDVGTRHRKQEISLPDLNPVDRSKMWDILWANGMTKPLFISLYPNSTDLKQEQTHQLYGKLMKTPVMGTPYFNRSNATLEIEEV